VLGHSEGARLRANGSVVHLLAVTATGLQYHTDRDTFAAYRLTHVGHCKLTAGADDLAAIITRLQGTGEPQRKPGDGDARQVKVIAFAAADRDHRRLVGICGDSDPVDLHRAAAKLLRRLEETAYCGQNLRDGSRLRACR
jgi:hypothetical protein